jgi:hypothetical protein
MQKNVTVFMSSFFEVVVHQELVKEGRHQPHREDSLECRVFILIVNNGL